jgi:hypothetical protein
MNIIEIKSGTKKEIVDYLRPKVTKVVKDVTNGSKGFGETGEKYSPWDFKEEEIGELESNTIEKQIDYCIQNGSPIAVVSLCGKRGVGTYRERFFVADYGEVRTNVELERIDNMELRDRRIDAIKMVMKMELEAEERWDRILKIVDEYRGKVITL